MNQNENPGTWVYHVVVSSTPINRQPQPDGSIPDEIRWSYFIEAEEPLGMRHADEIRDRALVDLDHTGLDRCNRTLCVEKIELMSGPPATDHEVVREQLAALPSETIDSLRVEAELRGQIQALSGIVDTLTTENGALITEVGETRAENKRLGGHARKLYYSRNTYERELRELRKDLLERGFTLHEDGTIDESAREFDRIHAENVSLRDENRRLGTCARGMECAKAALEQDHDNVLLRLTKLENENQQLRYERQLLGQARRTLDEVSEQIASSVIRKRAEDMSQRIVDEIGHPATDEPALGANLRILRDLTADLLQRINEDRTLDCLVSGDRGKDREPVMFKLLDRMAALVAGTQDREVDL